MDYNEGCCQGVCRKSQKNAETCKSPSSGTGNPDTYIISENKEDIIITYDAGRYAFTVYILNGFYRKIRGYNGRFSVLLAMIQTEEKL